MQILDQRAVALIVHRCHLLLHLLHGNEWLRSVDVPRELIEHREKTIQRHHAHAVFDEAPREQTTLAEAVHSVALAHRWLFLREIKRLARLFARHHSECGMKRVVE